ncbi:response regulator [bacterium]|nr:response regulator [bacterium]
MASILVIEDDDNFSSTLVELLSEFYSPVESAASAAEAIEKARKCPFHLVLTDVRVAGAVDGVSALESIQALQPKIRSIIMTGYSDLDVPLRAARLQADDYLQKPFRLNVLLESIRSILERETPIPHLFQRLLSAQKEAAQKAIRLLYDARLQQLNQTRDQCLQRFFLLVRAQRVTQDKAYLGFCHWEQLELKFLQENSPQGWSRLSEGYAQLAEHWLEPAPVKSKTLSKTAFGQLYQKIQAGLLDTLHLCQAIQLLHFPDSRRENVKAYCTYHWLWSHPARSEDCFLGLRIEGYTLKSSRHGPNSQVRLYEATHSTQPAHGDMVLCLPIAPDSQPLVRLELDSQRATLLHTGMGHYFLLYRGHSLSLKYQLPPNGLSPQQAWELLRPVFVQVMDEHRKGRASGCFSLKDIDLLPGQVCQLSTFSDGAYRAQHLQMAQHGAIMLELHAAPEVSRQAQPSPASDQAVLGRILFEVIFGGSYPDPNTRLHIHFLGTPEANRHFRPFVERLGPLSQVFYRLCQCRPEQRYASLAEAVQAIDQILVA